MPDYNSLEQEALLLAKVRLSRGEYKLSELEKPAAAGLVGVGLAEVDGERIKLTPFGDDIGEGVCDAMLQEYIAKR